MKSLVLAVAALGAVASDFRVWRAPPPPSRSALRPVARSKVSDSSPVSALTVWFTESPVGRRLQAVVDDGARWIDAGLSTGATRLVLLRVCGNRDVECPYFHTPLLNRS
ncbi:hypothetical protein H4W30_008439 [Amycolatopsis roodepoortensis]|uniref:Secreted protein n=1 Tax=Amycolatopsis roodepoortensis TaxID=700274 RepID=A0ABR9LL37_9PSEU|nr:hypothetical protein [Amycolatopsis roodepoortensis]